jgi:hypothetical protein
MVTISHRYGRLTCTAEHPIWVLEKGWLQARNVHSGDRLQTVANQESLVNGIIKFSVGDTYYRPSTLSEKLCLAGVPLGVTVPVCPVNLKGDMGIRQQKVNAIPSHSRLLDVLDLERIKDMAHGLFKQCFTLKSSVAGKRAELSIDGTGQRTKGHATGATLDNAGWSSARLRAVVPGVSVLRDQKEFAATFAGLIPFRLVSTLKAANGIAVGNGTQDSERLTTDGARFGDGEMGGTTILTAVPAIVGNGTGATVDFFAATRTRNKAPSPFGQMVARSRAIDLLSSWYKRLAALWADFRVHSIRSLTTLRQLYHSLCGTSSLTVYNLQVEGDPVFFADGVLVHNCPICGPLDGTPESVWGAEFPDGPPAHVRCRCSDGLSTQPDKVHIREAIERGKDRIEMLKEEGQENLIPGAQEALRDLRARL